MCKQFNKVSETSLRLNFIRYLKTNAGILDAAKISANYCHNFVSLPTFNAMYYRFLNRFQHCSEFCKIFIFRGSDLTPNPGMISLYGQTSDWNLDLWL